MTTVGYTTVPTTNSDFGTFAGEQAATSFTMPATGGLISTLHVHVATDNATSNAGYLCLWDSGGNLLTSVAATIPASENWVVATLATPYFMAASTVFFIGAQINSAGAVGLLAHYDTLAGSTTDFAHNGTIPGALANITTFTTSSLGAYADYTVGIYVNTGTSGSPVWTAAPVFINTGTSGSPIWTPAAGVFVNTGTSGSPIWTPTG